MTEDRSKQAESRGVTRRQVLGAGAAGGALLATGLVFPDGAEASPDRRHKGRGTTLERTLLRGQPGVGGYRPIVAGPGEPHLIRDDLVGNTPRNRHDHRRAIAAFGQLTDMHILDAQSPARVEFLDRYNDPGSPFASVLPFQSSWRPQEMLTAQVAEAMVQAINRVRRAPVTGLPLSFTISTGDNVDNTQHNELRWQIDLLDGGTVRPDSGNLTRFEGVMDQASYDLNYWHPDGAPAGQPTDLPTSTYGFPHLPGLLDATRRPFEATGLRMPWLSVFGNHDGLVQGNVPSNPIIAGLATGPVKFIGLPAGTNIIQLALGLQAGDPAALQLLFSGPFRLVTPDQDRRPLSRQETIAEHFNTTSHPDGHGYRAQNQTSGKAYYAFDSGVVRGLVLDTVNPFGGSEGSVDAEQLTWLTAELAAGSSRYLDASGAVVKHRVRDRLLVIFSHHSIGSMTNAAGIGRILGPAVRDLLLRFPNVVLWVNGHTHRNTVRPYGRVAGAAIAGGFWEINTAAHIDWPQQARVVELMDNGDGTLSVFGTLIDHAAPLSPGHGTPDSPLDLASLSRELGANDWQNDFSNPHEDGRRGAVEDRNVELRVLAPFKLAGR
jgi:metallophosphoesterase (TIGR03767 family)